MSSSAAPTLLRVGPLLNMPQGSVLEHVLFCIYSNDLHLHVSPNYAKCHMLTDDTALYTTGKSIIKIQETIQLRKKHISMWCNANYMLFNPVKNKSTIFTTRQRHQFSDLSLSQSFDGQTTEYVTEHRLLSVIVDYKLRWQAQIEHKCKIFF